MEFWQRGRGRSHFQGRDDTQVDQPIYLHIQVCCFLSMLTASHISSLCQTSAYLFFSPICQHSHSHLNRIWDFTAADIPVPHWFSCFCMIPNLIGTLINSLPFSSCFPVAWNQSFLGIEEGGILMEREGKHWEEVTLPRKGWHPSGQKIRSPNIPACTGMLLPFHAVCILRFFLVPNLSLLIFLANLSEFTLTPE